MNKRKLNTDSLILHIIFIVVCLIWIYPFLWMLFTSFKTEEEMFASGLRLLPSQFRFENFIRAWKQANFSVYFWNTVIVTFWGVLVTLFLTATSGYVLGRYKFPGKNIFAVLVVAMMFMPKGYTIIPIFELIRRMGLLDSLAGIVMAQVGGINTMGVLLFMGAFSQLPKELEEVAKLDGANFPRIFWQIMLPMVKPIIATVSIFQFMSSWNDFFTPLVFTLGKPELRTLGVGMYSFIGEYSTDWVGMAAAASISLIPIIVMYVCLQRYFIEGVAGAVKG
jgi:raffinose/stachyose/melibiose transport system permease protein